MDNFKIETGNGGDEKEKDGSALFKENFEGVTFEATKDKSSDILGGTPGQQMNFNAKKGGSSFKTVTGTGNTYVLATVIPNGNDPQINLDNSSGIQGGLAALLDGKKSVTFKFDLALAEGYNAASSAFRIRGSSPWTLVKTSEVGNKILAEDDTEVGILSTEFQTVEVNVDFEANTVSVKVGDGEAVVKGFADGATRLASCNSFIFNWYFSANGGDKNNCLLIDNIEIN